MDLGRKVRVFKPISVEDFSPYRIAEFWSKCVLTPTGCLEYGGGGVNNKGYAHIEMRGRTSRSHRRALAHRAAYAMIWGDCPADLELLHSCDNKICVAYWHLTPGTHAENMQDMVRKGRHWRQQTSQEVHV